jgi:hypothetical protein
VKGINVFITFSKFSEIFSKYPSGKRGVALYSDLFGMVWNDGVCSVSIFKHKYSNTVLTNSYILFNLYVKNGYP